MKIGVVKSDNRKVWRVYIIYICWAYRDGSCKNETLAKSLKKSLGLIQTQDF